MPLADTLAASPLGARLARALDVLCNRATIKVVETRSAAMELTAVLIHAEEGGFVALNPETGTTTQGETVEEAVANLKEATGLYLSEFPMPKTGCRSSSFAKLSQ